MTEIRTEIKMIVEKVAAALQALKVGKLIIVADDDTREAEGDFIGLAEFATTESLNSMIRHARGLICAPMTEEIAKTLGFPPMTTTNTDSWGTAFTISTDHITTSTGISAADRAVTIKVLANPNSQPADFHRPGHIFPLVAEAGGVLVRRGHTEAAVDLAKLAQAVPVAYICEVLNLDGTMARTPQLKEIATEFSMPFLTVEEIASYRYYTNHEAVQEAAVVQLPTDYGNFQLHAFTTVKQATEIPLMISKGLKPSPTEPILVRLHSECLTGDVLGSHRCDCGSQLHQALTTIEAAGEGVVLYLRQEGRGIGLLNKLKAYELQEQGLDTYDANLALGFAPDEREYGIAAAILHANGLKKIKLMTNNPDKVAQLEKYGIEVVERVPLELPPNKDNQAYLATKALKFQHFLSL